MKKNWLRDSLDPGVVKKISRTMRLTIFLFFGIVFTVSASDSYSQSKRMDLNLKNKTIIEAFNHIEENSEFIFIYKDENIDLNKRVDIVLSDANIEQILDEILEDNNLTYTINNKQIIIREIVTVDDEYAEQERSITGIVNDWTGLPLPGVTVIVKGTTIGTTTGVDGSFTLSIPDDAKELTVSFVGMQTQNILIEGKMNFVILMEEDVIGLGEVVAIGYGSQKKKELTGSVVGLKKEELLQGSQTSPMGMLQGKVAGLNIIKPNGGDPNGNYVYQIRGTSSLTGNTTPLIIIDGIPQGDLSTIPQDEIESIDILKDGSAAAIYGTRGTNGVILVTTKKGKVGKSTVDYNAYVSVPTILNTPNIMNREQFLEFGGVDRGSNTDWVKEITNNPLTHSHNVAVTGGTNDFNYRGSVSYKNNPGLEINSGFEEVIGRFLISQSYYKIKLVLIWTQHIIVLIGNIQGTTHLNMLNIIIQQLQYMTLNLMNGEGIIN